RTLTCTSIGASALTTPRQAATMTQAAIAAQIHQPLDVHGHFTAQIALHRETADFVTQTLQFRIGHILDLGAGCDAGGSADFLRTHVADAKDGSQGNNGVLVVRYVYPCNTGHSVTLIS